MPLVFHWMLFLDFFSIRPMPSSTCEARARSSAGGGRARGGQGARAGQGSARLAAGRPALSTAAIRDIVASRNAPRAVHEAPKQPKTKTQNQPNNQK